ncbi:hypothetical protein J2W97_002667 [Paenibacillus jamilae]|nr:hypothetical protein [Paenibacillus jamilae]
MKLNEHILLWNHVFIQVMDVLHKKMDKGKNCETTDFRSVRFYILYAEVRGYG